MKWFKHDTDAHRDPKIQKVLNRWGSDGYAVYWYCLELIAYDVGKDNLTFELEHDAELIGIALKIDQLKVQEIMVYLVNLGLFQDNSGKITCLQLARRLDQSMTGNTLFRKEIKKLSHDSVMTVPDLVMKEKEKEKEKTDMTMFDLFWDEYPKKVGKKKAAMAFRNLTRAQQAAAVDDLKAGRYVGTVKQFVPNPTTYIHGERWEDEQDADRFEDPADDLRGCL